MCMYMCACVYASVPKRALHICKRALHICKRVLNICKRALHICKRAVHICKRALHICKRALYICKRAPHIHTTYICKRAPHIHTYKSTTKLHVYIFNRALNIRMWKKKNVHLSLNLNIRIFLSRIIRQYVCEDSLNTHTTLNTHTNI